MNYLTIGTLWKDEHDVCEEFIDYHLNAIDGVDKIIIFDREYHQIKKMIGDNPKVEVHHYPESPVNLHHQAWVDIAKLVNGKTRWLSCIDADQCLIPVQTKDMQSILKNYEDYAALQINWSTFTSNKQIDKLPGSLYERFTESALTTEPVNKHTQFIIDPSKASSTKGSDPHTPSLLPGNISVNTNKQIVHGPFSEPIDHSILYCAHYINKSQEEYAKKQKKGRADIFGQFMPDMFKIHEFQNVKQDVRAKDLWLNRKK